MTTAEQLHPQFVTDPGGRQTAVILPLAEFHALLEDLDDLACVAERRHEPTIPHSEVLAVLRDDGHLPA